MIYLKNLLITILVLLLVIIIFGSLSYFNIISENILNIIKNVSIFITISIESFYLGKNKDKKGYLEGLINGGILSMFFLIINILFKRNFNIYKIVFYIIIVLISMFSSILGINKKMKD